jgi:pimeloyl-ACP methyl ester carboxylesterase
MPRAIYTAMRQLRTNDGVALNCFEAGSGPPIILIHGWRQSGALFVHQIEELSSSNRVLVLELRGHGRSERPAVAFTVARLAKDLAEVLSLLGLRDCVLLGHSMGCAVIWSYLELFGQDRLRGLILVDQPARMLINARAPASENEAAGGLFSAAELEGLYNAIRSPIRSTGFVDRMLTGLLSSADREWLIEENMALPPALAAELFFNLSMADWRSVITRITLPTLIIGGRASTTPWRSQAWIHSVIPDSRFEIFEADEGGGHLMFLENPTKFNKLVTDFLNQPVVRLR